MLPNFDNNPDAELNMDGDQFLEMLAFIVPIVVICYLLYRLYCWIGPD